ncbi:MAG TPA: cyclase family protein [Thermoanaerobaculia bacterium]|jgi:kynurenine formamidase|nr:cyclase family protein [Thermoanaerobaculia bacterium]
MTRFIDLSHTIGDGTVTYPGLPPLRISDYINHGTTGRYADGTTFHIARIEMVANTGTYLDAPSHRYEGEKDLAELPLEQLADLEGITIDAREAKRIIDGSFFAARDVRKKAVLVNTGWSRHFGSEQYGKGHPYLTEGAARLLVEAGAALVGIDSVNIDDTATGERPVHTTLLRAGIVIVEHLTNLGALPADGFRFHAVPPKVRGAGSFPVRAFAILKAGNEW